MWKKLSIAAGIVLLLLIGIRSSFAGERQSRYMVGIAPNDIRYAADRDWETISPNILIHS